MYIRYDDLTIEQEITSPTIVCETQSPVCMVCRCRLISRSNCGENSSKLKKNNWWKATTTNADTLERC